MYESVVTAGSARDSLIAAPREPARALEAAAEQKKSWFMNDEGCKHGLMHDHDMEESFFSFL